MAFVDWLGAWPGAAWLQGSATAYIFVNAAHILAVGLVLGAVLPLDLRLAGGLRSVPLTVAGPLLSRIGATGVALALLTGLWLFTVNAAAYLDNTAFLYKLGLLGLALANVAWQHLSPGLRRAYAGDAVSPGVKLRALLSVLLWLAVLVAGRWIGFL